MFRTGQEVARRWPGGSQAVASVPRQAGGARQEAEPALRAALPSPVPPPSSPRAPSPALRFHGYNQIITFIKFEITF